MKPQATTQLQPTMNPGDDAAVLLLREEASAAVLRENPGEPLRSGFVVFVGFVAPTGLNTVGTALGTPTGHGGGLVGCAVVGGLAGLRERRKETNERGGRKRGKIKKI